MYLKKTECPFLPLKKVYEQLKLFYWPKNGFPKHQSPSAPTALN